jgi:ATP-dependent DNA helicase UvrD/PcrA
MMADPDLAMEVGERFDHVLVDEYQDTNRLQSKILMRLKPNGRGVMIVGDDAQSIYSFRAATIRNILEFPSQFNPPAPVITLEQNIGRPSQFLTLVMQLLALQRNGSRKTCFRSDSLNRSLV